MFVYNVLSPQRGGSQVRLSSLTLSKILPIKITEKIKIIAAKHILTSSPT
jgi:hypothetical protein